MYVYCCHGEGHCNEVGVNHMINMLDYRFMIKNELFIRLTRNSTLQLFSFSLSEGSFHDRCSQGLVVRLSCLSPCNAQPPCCNYLGPSKYVQEQIN